MVVVVVVMMVSHDALYTATGTIEIAGARPGGMAMMVLCFEGVVSEGMCVCGGGGGMAKLTVLALLEAR